MGKRLFLLRRDIKQRLESGQESAVGRGEYVIGEKFESPSEEEESVDMDSLLATLPHHGVV